jgi:hypothetical protein
MWILLSGTSDDPGNLVEGFGSTHRRATELENAHRQLLKDKIAAALSQETGKTTRSAQKRSLAFSEAGQSSTDSKVASHLPAFADGIGTLVR